MNAVLYTVLKINGLVDEKILHITLRQYNISLEE